MKIKAVLMDFDNTLGDRQKYTYRLFAEMVDQYGKIADPVLREAVIQHLMIWDQRGNFRKNFWQKELAATYGITMDQDAETFWMENQYRFVCLYDKTLAVLKELKKDYKLGVVTNGTIYGQKKKLEISGIYDLMDAVVIGGEFKNQKPYPDMYKAALKKLDVEPQQCVFVGDTFFTDILGAYGAGITPVWLRLGDYTEQTMIRTISSIGELPALLKEMER